MAAYTVSVDRNFHDAFFSARAGADTYVVNYGATLTIDGDTRYGPNTSPTTGVLGNSDASLGTILFDARKVRLIPFNAATGVVPAADTVISQGGASGKLLGVWSSLTTTPTAVGAAMPATGFLKIRQAVGTFAAGALTGVAATATGPDRVGWIEVAGLDVGGFQVGGRYMKVQARGEYFDLGVTNGTANQQFQAPRSVSNTHYCGAFIETAVGSGEFMLWPNVGTVNNAATDERGKVTFVNSSGLITIGHNGTASAGFVPPAGLRVVVPNILLVNTNTTVGYAANVMPLNGVSRFTMSKTGSTAGARIDLDGAVVAWAVTQGQLSSVDLYRTVFADVATLNASLKYVSIRECGVGASGVDTGPTGPSLALATNAINRGVSMERVVALGQAANGRSVFGMGACFGLSVKDCRFFHSNGNTNTSQSTLTFSSLVDSPTFENCEFIGGPANFGTCVNAKITGTKFASRFLGTVTRTVLPGAFTLGVGAVFDGLSWVTDVADTCHPSGFLFAQSGDIKIRNIGTPAAKLKMGTEAIASNGLATLLSNGYKVQIDRVHVEGGATSFGTNITNATFPIPLVLQNCTIETNRPGGKAFGLPSNAILRNVRTDASQLAVGPAGCQFLYYFMGDTGGEILLVHGVIDGNYIYPDCYTLENGAYMPLQGMVLPVANSSAFVFESPYRVYGHTGFANTAQFIQSNNVRQSNISVSYDLDKGSGYSGTWKDATGANMSAETGIDPVVGFGLRVRVISATAGLSISPAKFITTSTLASQALPLWPMDVNTITVNNLATGSIVKVTRTDTGAVLFTGSESAGQVSFTADFTGQILVEARKASGAPYYQPWTALATVNGDITVTAVQIRDDQ